MESVKEIRGFYKGLSERYTTSANVVEDYLFDTRKYQAAIEDVRSRLKIKLSSGLCSTVLVGQIARHYCHLGERFADSIEFYHGSTILDTIELLESGKLKGREFTRSRLIGGLYKEHHSALAQASFISKNIFNGLNERALQSAKERSEGSLSGLLNTLHSDIIQQRKEDESLTGEWIVFTRIGNVNYYLCLATHKEGEGQAEIIYDKIKPALEEFPALAHFKGRK